MSPLLLPFQLVLLKFSGWVNRHQRDVIEHLQEENRVLKERLGGRRIASATPNAGDWPEKQKHPWCKVSGELTRSAPTPFCDGIES